ncbi:MAG: hypothetical protein JXR70_05405 [Spirochaetales bacterium]|nr:hypothetical protein [Spirochaetales bacterium]
MSILFGVIIMIIFTLIGIFLWASADFPLAIREIAINTRRKVKIYDYAPLKVMSIMIKAFAVIIWLAGLVLGLYIASLNHLTLPGFN